MKRLVLFLAAWPALAQLPYPTIPDSDGFTFRSRVNANFGWLYNNKAGLSTCNPGLFTVQTTAGGVSCLAVDWGVLTGKPSTFAPPLPGASSLGGIKSGDCTGTDKVSGIDPATGQIKCAADQTGSPGSGYNMIQANGTPITQQTTLNLVNGTNIAVTCTDATSITRCSFAFAGSLFNQTLTNNGTTLPQRSSIALNNGTNITVSCSDGAGVTACNFNLSGSVTAAALAGQYIDWNQATGPTSIANKPTIPSASSSNPLMNGTAAPGTGSAFSRFDHIHPTDTTRLAANNPTFTGTMTGPAYTTNSPYSASGPAVTLSTGLASARPACSTSPIAYLASDTNALTVCDTGSATWGSALNPTGSYGTIFNIGTGRFECYKDDGTSCAPTGGATFYQTAQVGGSPQVQRAKMNFVAGANVSITPADNGSDTTTLTFTATAGGSGSSGALAAYPGHNLSASPSTLYALGSGAVPYSYLFACSAAYQGVTHWVSDSNVATWGSSVASGGVNLVEAKCNGTAWTVSAK